MEHNTSVMYRALLRREKEHFAGRKIQDIGPDEIDADINHIAGQGYSRWGVQVYLDMLRGKHSSKESRAPARSRAGTHPAGANLRRS